MTKWQRLRSLLVVILQCALIVLLIAYPEGGKEIVISILSIILSIKGLGFLSQYFSIARYMVGGRAILYRGAIFLDAGIVLGLMQELPSYYLMGYLVGYFLLHGAYRAFKAYTTRNMGKRVWLNSLVLAIWYPMLAVIGMVNFFSERAMVFLFCLELGIWALGRIRRLIHKTALVYIP